MSHCRRASRPQVLWVELSLLGKKYDLDDHVLCNIHGMVVSSLPAERNGMGAFEARAHRETAARQEAGAEKPVKLWQLLGFQTLSGFISHRHQERMAEQARFNLTLQKELPDFVLFGYQCQHQYKLDACRANRTAKRRLASYSGAGAT